MTRKKIVKLKTRKIIETGTGDTNQRTKRRRACKWGMTDPELSTNNVIKPGQTFNRATDTKMALKRGQIINNKKNNKQIIKQNPQKERKIIRRIPIIKTNNKKIKIITKEK